LPVAKMAQRLSSQRFGWGRVFALAVLAAFLALRAWDAAPLQLVRLKTFDLYQLAKPRVPTTRPVVIVDIDEASLNSLGQWPWPRPLVAKLIDQITALPVVIGFDIVFLEPDRTSPALLAETRLDLSPSACEELTRQPATTRSWRSQLRARASCSASRRTIPTLEPGDRKTFPGLPSPRWAAIRDPTLCASPNCWATSLNWRSLLQVAECLP
jgi:hypothetical protein